MTKTKYNKLIKEVKKIDGKTCSTYDFLKSLISISEKIDVTLDTIIITEETSNNSNCNYSETVHFEDIEVKFLIKICSFGYNKIVGVLV